MAEEKLADTKLVQYLNEAYGKEREVETALQAHIGMTTKKSYKKRLQDHLKETKAHARELERRIKKIGRGGPGKVGSVAGQVTGQAKSRSKGPLHLVRGTGDAEKMLKNAKTEYFNEHEEIATYTALETLAESLGDTETAKLARSVRREEERMARFLEKQIPQLTKAVVREEVPASERRSDGGGRRRRTTTARSSRAGSSRSASSRSRKTATSRTRGSSRGTSRSRKATRSRSR